MIKFGILIISSLMAVFLTMPSVWAMSDANIKSLIMPSEPVKGTILFRDQGDLSGNTGYPKTFIANGSLGIGTDGSCSHEANNKVIVLKPYIANAANNWAGEAKPYADVNYELGKTYVVELKMKYNHISAGSRAIILGNTTTDPFKLFEIRSSDLSKLIFGSSSDGSMTVSPDSWYHLKAVISMDESVAKKAKGIVYYIDGTKRFTQSDVVINASANSSRIRLFASNNTAETATDAMYIDDMYVYELASQQLEINNGSFENGTYTFDVKNNSGTAVAPTAIIAVFDGNTLSKIDYAVLTEIPPFSTAVNRTVSTTAALTAGKSAKVFLWDNIIDAKPLALRRDDLLNFKPNANLAGLYPMPAIKPPSEHPRVCFRAADIPRIKENTENPENVNPKNKYLNDLAFMSDGRLAPLTGSETTNFNDNILASLESKALDYALNGNKESGYLAVSGIKNYLDTLILDTPVSDNYVRPGGTVIYVTAEIYDWCHNLLTFDDKRRMIAAVENMAGGLSVGWPPKNRSPVADHPAEAQLLRDLLAFSIAAYDERPDIYNVVAGRIFSEYVEVRQFHYQNGVHHQGTYYGAGRGQWDMASSMLFKTIGFPDIFGRDIEKLSYYLLYLRRPDGLSFREGDGTNYFTASTYQVNYGPRAQLLISNYFKNPYAKYDAMQQNPNFSNMSYTHGSISAVDILLFNDPGVIPMPPQTLPNSRYFGGPNGMILARTGWQTGKSAPTVAAQMKIDEWWFGNHDHLDNGSFQLYYKGALAFHTGDYPEYGTSHDYNFHKRTIAHNGVLVYDPNEPMPVLRGIPLVNDGGQRFINNTDGVTTFDNMKQGEYGQIGKILAHAIGPDLTAPDYSYLKGDITKSYTSKVEKFERSFIFLDMKNQQNPGVMVIFDHLITSDPSFKKTWLLNGMQEPVVTGNRTVFKNTVNGYNGKLTIDTLLPEQENTNIVVVGGRGKEAFVNGTNYPSIEWQKYITDAGDYKYNSEKASWRMELSPLNSNKEDYFLNVLQVGDAVPDTPPMAVSRINNERLAGVQIADRVVAFSKNEDRTGQNLQFDMNGSGTYKIMVAGVHNGVWQITRNGALMNEVTATEDGGLLYFEGTAGAYELGFLHQ